jgi:hypothetical protein
MTTPLNRVPACFTSTSSAPLNFLWWMVTDTASAKAKRAWKERFLSQGYDKVQTLSLCRFDAFRRYGINKVIGSCNCQSM